MDTKEITIAGSVFPVSQPYAEGHVVTLAEAKALNQVRAENIRNNMASKVKAATESPTDECNASNIAALVAAYDAEYQFTLASVGGGKRSVDPVEVEALKIARALLSEALKTKGISITKLPEEVRNAKIAEISESDAVLKEARKRVEARKKQAADLLEGLDMSEFAPAGSGAAAE